MSFTQTPVSNAGHLGNHQSVKQDSLTSCLERIAAMVDQLPERDYRFEKIADTLTGSTHGAIESNPAAPEPHVAVFIARSIENRLGEHLTRMQDNASRLEGILL